MKTALMVGNARSIQLSVKWKTLFLDPESSYFKAKHFKLGEDKDRKIAIGRFSSKNENLLWIEKHLDIILLHYSY